MENNFRSGFPSSNPQTSQIPQSNPIAPSSQPLQQTQAQQSSTDYNAYSPILNQNSLSAMNNYYSSLMGSPQVSQTAVSAPVNNITQPTPQQLPTAQRSNLSVPQMGMTQQQQLMAVMQNPLLYQQYINLYAQQFASMNNPAASASPSQKIVNNNNFNNFGVLNPNPPQVATSQDLSTSSPLNIRKNRLLQGTVDPQQASFPLPNQPISSGNSVTAKPAMSSATILASGSANPNMLMKSIQEALPLLKNLKQPPPPVAITPQQTSLLNTPKATPKKDPATANLPIGVRANLKALQKQQQQPKNQMQHHQNLMSRLQPPKVVSVKVGSGASNNTTPLPKRSRSRASSKLDLDEQSMSDSSKGSDSEFEANEVEFMDEESDAESLDAEASDKEDFSDDEEGWDSKPRRKSSSSSKKRSSLPRRKTKVAFTDFGAPDDNEEEADLWTPDMERKGGAQRSSTSSLSRNVSFSNKSKSYSEFSDEEGELNSSDEDAKKKNALDPNNLIEEINEDIIEMVMDDREGEREIEGKLFPVTEYLIKWKGWAHIHNGWFTREELTTHQYKGIKKVDNYIKRKLENEKRNQEATPEEVDQFMVEEALTKQIQEEYTRLDRVIASRTTEPKKYNFEGVEYETTEEFLVKWRHLPYSECTWEYPKLIEEFQSSIDEFRERNSKGGYLYPIIRKPAFQKMTSQPDCIKGGEIRDYQLEGLNWLYYSWCNNINGILADEMGLGKTIQTISFLSLLHSQNIHGPFLVVVPLSTLTNWMKEFQKWAPQMYVVSYIGDAKSRAIIREYELFFNNRNTTNASESTQKFKANVILTTYELIIRDAQFLGPIEYSFMAIDEAHRLKNDKSKLYEILIKFSSYGKLLITGTPLQNTLRELWCLLHFLQPDKYASFEIFESKYGDLKQEKNLEALHKEMAPHILRRLKSDVEKSLPRKIERILRVELAPLQKQYYSWILTKNYQELRKGGSKTTSLLNIVIELKKVCNHPFLFESAKAAKAKQDKLTSLIESCGKLLLLDKLLSRLKETGHRVLIFSQMVRMLDILGEYLALRGFTFQRLDGSTSNLRRQQVVDHFNAPDSTDFCFLLSTRAGGLGINLTSADTVIIFDSDWNPQNDLQAEARAHRIGQTKVVSIYRLITKDSVEEKILESARQKMILDHLVIQKMDTTGRTVLNNQSTASQFTREELNEVLKFGAANLFAQTEEKEEDQLKRLNNIDIDAILERAETVDSAQQTNQAANASFMNSFKVANFSITDLNNGAPINNNTNKKESKANGKEEDAFWEILSEEKRQKILRMHDEIEDSPLQGGSSSQGKKKAVKKDKSEPLTTQRTTRNGANYFAGESDGDYEEDEDEDPTVAEPNEGKRRSARNRIAGFTIMESKAVLKSFKRFYDISRAEEILDDSGLKKRKVDEVKEFCVKLEEACREEMKQRESTGVKQKGKPRNIFFNDISVNASEIVTRMNQVKAVQKIIDKYDDQNEFREMVQPRAVKSWPQQWDIRDDANLLRGVLKHGFGVFDLIKADKALGLGDKIGPDSSSQKKYITYSQLQKRLDALLEAAYEETENSTSNSASSSQDRKSSTSSSITTGTTTTRRKNKNRADEMNTLCAQWFKPVQSDLTKLKSVAVEDDSSLAKSDRLNIIKETLYTIGGQIERVLEEHKDTFGEEKLKETLWQYVRETAKTSGEVETLQSLYKRLKEKKGGSAAPSVVASKQATPSSSSVSTPQEENKNKPTKVIIKASGKQVTTKAILDEKKTSAATTPLKRKLLKREEQEEESEDEEDDDDDDEDAAMEDESEEDEEEHYPKKKKK